MLDFLKIGTREGKKDTLEIYPIFKVQKTKDLMIRGGDFYCLLYTSPSPRDRG